MMIMTLRRNTNKGVGKVKVIMLMIIMKTYQVPCSQGQKSTLVLHLLKKRPEAIFILQLEEINMVYSRLELFLPMKNAVKYSSF